MVGAKLWSACPSPSRCTISNKPHDVIPIKILTIRATIPIKILAIKCPNHHSPSVSTMKGRILTPQVLELSGKPSRTCFYIIPTHDKKHAAESWVQVNVDAKPFTRNLRNHQDLCLFDGDTLLASWNTAPDRRNDIGWSISPDKARAAGAAYSQGRLCIRHRSGDPIRCEDMYNHRLNSSQVILRSPNGVTTTTRVEFFRHVHLQLKNALVTRVQATVPFSVKVVNDTVVQPGEWDDERRPNGGDLSCPARIPSGHLYAPVTSMVIEVDQYVGDGDVTFLVYGFAQ